MPDFLSKKTNSNIFKLYFYRCSISRQEKMTRITLNLTPNNALFLSEKKVKLLPTEYRETTAPL